MNASLAVTVSVGLGFLIFEKLDTADGEPWWDPAIEEERATDLDADDDEDELEPEALGFKRLYSHIEFAPQA